MIKLPEDTVVFEIPYEEFARTPKPHGAWYEGQAHWTWHLFLPEEYNDWFVHNVSLDERRDRWVIIMTKKWIEIQQDIVQSDEGKTLVLESIIDFL